MTKTKLVPLLVTTEHKGVFFGYGEPTEAKIIHLERARMCVYWCAEVRGILGLAATGPINGCRVTPQIPAITLQSITSVSEVSDKAAIAWEKDNWS